MSAKTRWIRGAWWLVLHFQGQRTKRRFGPTANDKAQAEIAAAHLNAGLAEGAFVAPPLRRAQAEIAFREYALDWLRREVQEPLGRGSHGHLAPMTVRQYESNLRVNLIPHLDQTDLRSIGVREVQRLHSDLTDDGLSPRSIEKVLGVLRRILDHARAGDLVGENPVRRWTELRPTTARRRSARVDRTVTPRDVFTAEELAKVLAALEAKHPSYLPLFLFLADTGARIGEASALRWIDVDLNAATARIERSFSSGKSLGDTKSGRARTVELSTRLVEAMRAVRPDLAGDDALAFPNEAQGLHDPRNLRDRIFRPIVRKAVGTAKRLSIHSLRHSFASLHMARGTPLKWIQAQGGWASAKMLLDVYGHFMPEESGGYANALAAPETAPRRPLVVSDTRGRPHARVEKRAPSRSSLVAQPGIEPGTRGFSVRCSTS